MTIHAHAGAVRRQVMSEEREREGWKNPQETWKPFSIAAQFWVQIPMEYVHSHHRSVFSEASSLQTPFYFHNKSKMKSKPLPFLPLDWVNSHQVAVGAHMTCWQHWRYWEEWKNTGTRLFLSSLVLMLEAVRPCSWQNSANEARQGSWLFIYYLTAPTNRGPSLSHLTSPLRRICCSSIPLSSQVLIIHVLEKNTNVNYRRASHLGLSSLSERLWALETEMETSSQR